MLRANMAEIREQRGQEPRPRVGGLEPLNYCSRREGFPRTGTFSAKIRSVWANQDKLVTLLPDPRGNGCCSPQLCR